MSVSPCFIQKHKILPKRPKQHVAYAEERYPCFKVDSRVYRGLATLKSLFVLRRRTLAKLEVLQLSRYQKTSFAGCFVAWDDRNNSNIKSTPRLQKPLRHLATPPILQWSFHKPLQSPSPTSHLQHHPTCSIPPQSPSPYRSHLRYRLQFL